jgi:WXG100 family type VII secretion target
MSGTGGKFELDHATMEQSVRNLQESHDAVTGLMTSLINNLEPLSTTWQGAAATAFMQLKQGISDNSTKMAAALETIREGLGQTSVNYKSTDDTNQADVNKVSARLNDLRW